ncbi:MAG: L-serine ammonia-lyase, iron-sulfur-dependent subunit beta [Hungatella hathewayi]|nr:L-serine ammonia-lyase, iron-sulfur-dependent subunit beta [Hungatella hathewayi]
MNVFDIVGPVMIGPSSSHTAGAARIGRIGRALLGEPAVEAEILLHGSFAKTYRGHGTDKALVAGILGLGPEDARLRESLELARRQGLAVTITTGELEDVHPNTARICLTGESGRRVSMQASSVGGGNVQVGMVDGMPVAFNCQNATLIVLHRDAPGMIAAVAEELGKIGVNISNFHLSREKKGGTAVMTIEMDAAPDEETVRRIEEIEHVSAVTFLEPV